MGDTTINLIEAEELPLSDTALERMMTFARQFGVAHTTLAMHAALPIGLTPEIVHLIRINFVPAAPWIAEADLLLSPLCREVGGDMYEMDAQVREFLLDEFNSNWRFGPAQVKALAEFMLAYVSNARSQTRDIVTLDILRAQEMVALAYAHPEEAARRFALAMRQGIETNDRDETLRMASLAQSLAAPLFAEGKVLIYAAGVEKLFDRDMDRAMRLFDSIGAATQPATIGGITLPPATEMAEQMNLTEPAPAAPVPFPLGFSLRATLRGHTHTINRMAWSPDGRHLASPSDDGTVLVWNADTWDYSRRELNDDDGVRQITWAPDGKRLASISVRGIVRLYDAQIGSQVVRFQESQPGYFIAWSPDGARLAWGTENSIFWIETGDASGQVPISLAASLPVTSAVAWSPDGKTLAATAGAAINLWDDLLRPPRIMYVSLERHITSLAWSPDGRTIVTGSTIGDITVSEPIRMSSIHILKGHQGYVTSLAFSFDGRLLASKSVDGTVRLWRCDRWEQVAVLDEPYPGEGVWSGLAFHPSEPRLATLDASGTAIRIWDLNIKALLGPEPAPRTITYKNAKAVLLGEPGVGKTALSLALTGQPSASTESTHDLAIRSFYRQEADTGDGSKEVREILLWDLEAGPNYQITNQLHFDDLAVALIVVDASRQQDWRTQVGFWTEALGQARRIEGRTGSRIRSYLIVSRRDMADQQVDFDTVQSLIKEYGIEGYFEISAKSQETLVSLIETIQQVVQWEDMPSLSVPDSPRFANVSNATTVAEEAIALVGQAKEAISKLLNDEFGSYRPLFSREDLRSAIEKRFADVMPPDELNARFDSGVRLAQTLGWLKRLNQGRDLLINPNHATVTAAQMIVEAQTDPQGLASLDEAKFRAQRGPVSDEMSAYYSALDQQLLEFVADELILRELAFRVPVEGRNYLVFPALLDFSSQPGLNEIDSLAHAVYSFTGPVRAIYATLLTRLARSKDFELQSTGANGAAFLSGSSQSETSSPSNQQTSSLSGSITMRMPTSGSRSYPICAIMLKENSATQGQLTILFESGGDDATRFLFEDIVRAHLFGWSPQANVTRLRVFVCQRCNTVFDSQVVSKIISLGRNTIQCPVCDTTNSLFDRTEALATALASITPEFPQQTGAWQERERIVAELERKLATGVFDVILSYYIEDKQAVTDIALRLLKRGMLPWFDVWESHNHETAQEALRPQISQIKSVALFAGRSGYQVNRTTTYPTIHELLHTGITEVPVILPGAQGSMSFPDSATRVEPIDFRLSDPSPMDELIRAISTPPVAPHTTPTEKASATKRAAKKQTPTRKSATKSSIKKVPKKK